VGTGISGHLAVGKELRRVSVEEEGGAYVHAPHTQAASERKRMGIAVS